MEITEVRIKLMEDNSGSNERLQAFCSITFDDMFVIRDLKIIEGAKGFFVAMPSRKLTDRCGLNPARHPPTAPTKGTIMPTPGCWTLHLSWGGRTDKLSLRYVR